MFSTCTNAYKLKDLAKFTHVFIDEAGQCNEAESAATFVGGGVQARVILAGDPKQLGPTTMGSSLLERIMLTREPYRVGDLVADPRYITKLIRNYRSHPDLLRVPSELFYENELLPCAELKLRNELVGWQGLPNPNAPIIFNDCTEGTELFTGNSFHNHEEALTAIEYATELVAPRSGCKTSVRAEDIFIITPYQAQADYIQTILEEQRALFDGVEVSLILYPCFSQVFDSEAFAVLHGTRSAATNKQTVCRSGLFQVC